MSKKPALVGTYLPGSNKQPSAPTKPKDAPGTIPDNKIPIFDHKGQHRGHVGRKATSATVARFLGQHGAKLGKKDGRTAWIGPKPPLPKPKVDPAAQAAQQAATAAKSQTNKIEISLKAAKGSVTKTPTKPETTVRPKRG